jgi:hypothetical protein
MQYLLLFHGKGGSTKATKCYAICSLPVLFLLTEASRVARVKCFRPFLYEAFHWYLMKLTRKNCSLEANSTFLSYWNLWDNKNYQAFLIILGYGNWVRMLAQNGALYQQTGSHAKLAATAVCFAELRWQVYTPPDSWQVGRHDNARALSCLTWRRETGN